MFRILFFLLLLSSNVIAQVTHSVSYSFGITNVLYKSDIKDNKSYASFFLPVSSLDYSKHNDNVFWGGAGVGFSIRQIPFFTYFDGQKTGIEAAEVWFRARAGLKFEGEFLSHLPYLGLGIATYADHNYYSKSNSTYSYLNNPDSLNNVQKYQPFLELGTKLINTSFREDKRNVSFTFAVRYYPLPVFKSPQQFEYDYFKFTQIQYHLIEFMIVAAIQHNVQK